MQVIHLNYKIQIFSFIHVDVQTLPQPMLERFYHPTEKPHTRQQSLSIEPKPPTPNP